MEEGSVVYTYQLTVVKKRNFHQNSTIAIRVFEISQNRIARRNRRFSFEISRGFALHQYTLHVEIEKTKTTTQRIDDSTKLVTVLPDNEYEIEKCNFREEFVVKLTL